MTSFPPSPSRDTATAPDRVRRLAAAGADWWRGAVIYQVYVRSFQDSNNDGVGDLAGIRKRLGYLADLGVDAIWLTPFLDSPMHDFGYDVRDYRQVAPAFGSLAEFDHLLNAAHARGLRIMVDLPLSHTSDQHLWFQGSREGRDGPFADFYVWAEARPDGTAPNNWLSIFGGPAWTWEGRRRQYYLHNFLAQQPDLNFHNPAVQDAVLEIIRFWLDRGVDGLRLDTLNFYFADKKLRDNPALPLEGRNASIAPPVNPYNHQLHIHSKNQPENLLFLSRMRALLDAYPGTAAMGEIGDAQQGIRLLGEYTRAGQGVHTSYAFDLMSPRRLTASDLLQLLQKVDVLAADGWPAWALSNHDVMRHATRFQLNDAGQRCFAALLFALRGSLCIYQAEELGLEEAQLELTQLRDPYGIAFWPEFRGRDGCRTPMPWDSSAPFAGFSDHAPWLPVPGDHRARAVDTQENSPGSMLNHYRHLISLRKNHPSLAGGDLCAARAQEALLQFERRDDQERLFCAFHLDGGEGGLCPELPEGQWKVLSAANIDDNSDRFEAHTMPNLGAWGFVILKLTASTEN